MFGILGRNKINSNQIAFISVLVILIAGCGTVPRVLYQPQAAVVFMPEINREAQAEIGQSIVSKAFVSRIPAVVLNKEVSENINYTSVTKIEAGTYLLNSTTDAGKHFQARETPYGGSGIFVPHDTAQPPVIYLAPMAGNYGKTPIIDLGFTQVEKWTTSSFKRELVYGGISQNTITILYREFADGTARPAFSQEIKYDLREGKVIGYKGARFEVSSASNTGIVYKVLQQLD